MRLNCYLYIRKTLLYYMYYIGAIILLTIGAFTLSYMVLGLHEVA